MRPRISFLVTATLALTLSSPAIYSQVVVSTTGKSGILGSAYDTHREDFIGQECVTGATVQAGPSESSLALDQTISEEQASAELGFAIGARARYGLVEGSGAAEFLRRSVSNAFSLSSIYRATYAFQPQKLTGARLSDIGRSVERNFERWNKTCGDTFVNEVRRGAKLFVSVRVEFESADRRNEFASSFSISGPLAGVNATLKDAARDFGRSARVVISAHQFGGDIEKISQILSSASGAGSDFTQCSLGQFESCAKVIESVLTYAADVKTGFPSQLAAGRKPGPADLSYSLAEYTSAGIYSRAYPGLVESVKISRDELSKLMEENYNAYLTVTRLADSRLQQYRRESFLAAVKDLRSNLQRLRQASQVCYETPEKCTAAVEALELVDVPHSLLRPPTFTDFCHEAFPFRSGAPRDHAFVPFISAWLFAVLQPERLPTFNIPPSADCDVSDEYGAANETDIKLSKRDLEFARLRVESGAFGTKVPVPTPELVDVTPLMSFRSATRANISGHRIRNIRAVSGLSKLDTLIAIDNDIQDLTALEGVTSLKEITLQNNGVQSLLPLSGLFRLTRLDLRKNRINSLEGLNRLSRLEVLDLEENLIADLGPLSNLPALKDILVNQNLIKSLSSFTPGPSLQRLIAMQNPLSDAEIDKFCDTYPHVAFSYTRPNGTSSGCNFIPWPVVQISAIVRSTAGGISESSVTESAGRWIGGDEASTQIRCFQLDFKPPETDLRLEYSAIVDNGTTAQTLTCSDGQMCGCSFDAQAFRNMSGIRVRLQGAAANSYSVKYQAWGPNFKPGMISESEVVQDGALLGGGPQHSIKGIRVWAVPRLR